MLRIGAGLAICLVAVVVSGCGTGRPAGSGARAAAARADRPDVSAAATSPSPACPGGAPAGSTAAPLVITDTANAGTYCVRVGSALRVELRGTTSDPWRAPAASGSVLASAGGTVTAGGSTSASFTAVRPGRAVLTSVRPPCQVAVPPKHVLEPAFPLPTPAPLRSCDSGYRFSALVIVTP